MRSCALLFFLLGIMSIRAQNAFEDSLLRKLNSSDEKEKINIYNNLCRELSRTDRKKAEAYLQKALEIAIPINDDRGLGDAYNNAGRLSLTEGNFSQAIDFFLKSFIFRKNLNDTIGMANLFSNIGVSYRKMYDYEKAMNYYMLALSLKEKTGNKAEILSVINNIGGLYYYQRNYIKAEEYYSKAKKLSEDLKDSVMIANTLSNLSLIEDQRANYKRALEFSSRAFEIRKKLGDPVSLAVSYNNTGRVYEHLLDTKKAKEFYLKALELYRGLGNDPDMTGTLYNMGSAYLQEKKYDMARRYFDTSLVFAKQLKLRLQIRDSYFGLAQANHYLGNHDEAFHLMNLFSDLTDSIYDEESQSKISEMEVKYQSEQKLKDIEVLKHKNEIQELLRSEEKRKQSVRSWFFAGGLVTALVIVLLLISRNNLRKKANLKLQTVNAEIVSKKEEIEKQKLLVDNKNKEITDSINYARRIQEAILPAETEFKKLFPGSFVFFRPRDIVSGDFYWVSEQENFIYYATVDCTGHGVPGGFMSVLAASLLNEIVNEKKLSAPEIILNTLRERIIQSLHQKGQSMETKDGMDMVFCKVDRKKEELIFAAANNPLWLLRDKTIKEFKADKQPVGISAFLSGSFSSNVLPLQKNDLVYTFTDGFADQFGGDSLAVRQAGGKKFKYKQFEKLLIQNCELPMETQKASLEKAFEDWKGNLEQVDDVLIIGIRI